MYFFHLIYKVIFIIFVSFLFTSYGMGEEKYGINMNATPITYDQFSLPRLTDDDFNTLSTEDKYRVALKLYSTLYYGTDMSDLNSSIHSKMFISQTYELFDRPSSVSEINEVTNIISNYGSVSKDGQVLVPILARLFHLTPGKEYFNYWTAYVLTQTILYCPGLELPNVTELDGYNIYNTLVNSLNSGTSIQWISFKHMIAQANWRRFKSPEDNGREMLEIFLNDTNDSHVPLAAKSLKNWQLDRSNTLVVSTDGNTEPITDLFENTTIISGIDFYSNLVLQPNFLPTVCRRLIDIYFPNYTTIQKDDIVSQLIISNPNSWTDILKQIIYSKEYLLSTEKTRSFEELFFPMAKTLNWHPHSSSFYNIYDSLNRMNQASMHYKLGRAHNVPIDTYSFASMHKTLRENLMIKYERNPSFLSIADGWGLQEIFDVIPDTLSTNREIVEYMVHALFIPTIGRDATLDEIQFFQDLVDRDMNDPDLFNNYGQIVLTGNINPEIDAKMRGYVANIILDYISRLSEAYQFKTTY